jgi:hypothetical protein
VAISIDYNLTARGWSECIVEIGDQHAHLTACYLSDALADLLNAVTIVLRGTEEATASFTEEPGEYRWRLKRVAPDRLWIDIVWFDEISRDRPDECGKVILTAQCRLRTFAGGVLSASQRVLATHGLEGYRKKWVNHEFPAKLHCLLQESLSR